MENTPVIAAWLTFIAVLLYFVGMDLRNEKDDSFFKKVIGYKEESVFIRLAKLTGPVVLALIPFADLNKIEQKLIYAGQPFNLTAEGFVGTKIVILGFSIVLTIFTATLGIPVFMGVILCILLYLLPDGWVNGLIEKRQKSIYKSLPDMIGLLATAVSSGVELGPSLEMVGKKLSGPLGDEIRVAWREIAAGKQKSSALKAMARRTGVNMVSRFVETIVTAEERGTEKITDVLNNFKYDLELSQQRKAEETARKIPTKMLGPLFLCIFLPMLALLITPIIFLLMKAL